MEKNIKKFVPIEDDIMYEINRDGCIRKRAYTMVYDDGTKIDVEPIDIPINTNGTYHSVILNGKKHLVHRLLAKAFLPNKNNLPHVKFKDGNKDNVVLDNLEWSEYLNGRLSMKEESDKYGSANGVKIKCIEDGNIFNSIVSASKYYGINQSTFSYRFWNKKKIDGKTFVMADKSEEPNVFSNK